MSVNKSGPFERETAAAMDAQASRRRVTAPGEANAGAGEQPRSRFKRNFLSHLWKACMGGTVLTGLFAPGLARAQASVPPAEKLFTSVEMVGFALVLGILSAAMLSAGWLIRQRGRLEAEGAEMRSAL
ncbi:MAG: hypothetical protein KUL88_03610, partial [Rhizobium sp.]|nr:hypothetical protein [Rhizobium sp.]